MEVYQYPFDNPLIDEPKPVPQVVKPKANNTQQARMVPPSVWYQIEIPKGLRWVHQDQAYGLGMERVEPVKQSVVMTTPFHFYKHPFSDNKEDIEQLPQTLQALGKQDSWYFIDQWCGEMGKSLHGGGNSDDGRMGE